MKLYQLLFVLCCCEKSSSVRDKKTVTQRGKAIHFQLGVKSSSPVLREYLLFFLFSQLASAKLKLPYYSLPLNWPHSLVTKNSQLDRHHCMSQKICLFTSIFIIILKSRYIVRVFVRDKPSKGWPNFFMSSYSSSTFIFHISVRPLPDYQKNWNFL